MGNWIGLTLHCLSPLREVGSATQIPHSLVQEFLKD
jgi:hypothetical protein